MPTTDQIDMDFDRTLAAPPAASPDEVSALAAYLTGKGWVTAREIIIDCGEALQLPAPMEAAKRRLRAIAEAGRHRILSYPGSRGYHLLTEANVEDINHGIHAHRSQARKHISGALALARYKHSRV